jgi:hypothetical protein
MIALKIFEALILPAAGAGLILLGLRKRKFEPSTNQRLDACLPSEQKSAKFKDLYNGK